MKKELEQQLVHEFPTFFREYGGDPQKTCMARGCEHGNGWFNLLQRLCQRLKAEADTDPATNFHFTSIKEKFARLTIYSTGGNQMMRNLIDTFEEMSLGVCEHCGSEEGVAIVGTCYIQTLCTKCSKI